MKIYICETLDFASDNGGICQHCSIWQIATKYDSLRDVLISQKIMTSEIRQVLHCRFLHSCVPCDIGYVIHMTLAGP